MNDKVEDIEANLVDSATVIVNLKDSFNGSIVGLLSIIENLDITVDSPAVVVMNEKTGTVVMGENVRVSTVAVAVTAVVNGSFIIVK